MASSWQAYTHFLCQGGKEIGGLQQDIVMKGKSSKIDLLDRNIIPEYHGSRDFLSLSENCHLENEASGGLPKLIRI
jgi:hypothetical protein